MSASRDQIKAMLDSVKQEIAQVKAQAKKRVEVLEARANTLEEWLAEEAPTPVQQTLPMGSGTNGSPLGAFLRSVLSDGKPRELNELSEMVVQMGLITGTTTPGRNVHFALVGLQQHGYVKRNSGTGKWAAAAPAQ